MLNSVALVGRVVKPVYQIENESYVDLQIKRPFYREIGLEEFDVFTVKLWQGVADQLLDYAIVGTMIALRGRLIPASIQGDTENKYLVIVYGEIIEILDKHFKK